MEIESKLDIEYKERFALEIKNAEQRVADIITQEEEKHAVERASLLEELQKERTKYRQQIEKSFEQKLSEELERKELQFKEQFDADRKQAEQRLRTGELPIAALVGRSVDFGEPVLIESGTR